MTKPDTILLNMITVFASLLDASSLIQQSGALAGLAIIGAIIFAETGLLIGFFLPGDTLLFTAGFFAASGHLPLAGVLATIFVAGVLGNQVGYFIGKHTGKRLFKRRDGILFRHQYLEQAEKFYERHGGKTIILARFVPVVRTFAPMVAGIGHMSRRQFLLYNIAGSALWTTVVVMLGYELGALIDPKIIERFLILAVGLAVLISLAPVLLHIARDPVARKRFKAKLIPSKPSDIEVSDPPKRS